MSKAFAELQKKLRRSGMRLFTTIDAAVALGVPAAHASVILGRAQKYGDLIRLLRGHWALPEDNPPHSYAVARFIAHPNPIYVTGPSALHHHGIIHQIPKDLHIAWTAKSRRYETPLGSFYFHTLPYPPEDELENVDTPDGPVPIATPEKALVDTARLAASPRGKASLFPELNLDDLNRQKIKNLLGKIAKPRTRRRIQNLITLPEKTDPVPLDLIIERIDEWSRKAGGWNRIGIFAGAGLSSNVEVDGVKLPLGSELPERILRLRASFGFNITVAEKIRSRIAKKNLSVAMSLEEIRTALGTNWDEAVKCVFRGAEPNELFFELVRLGSSLFLTTNQDRLLEKALAHPDGRNCPSVTTWPAGDVRLEDIITRVGPRVVHLHGDIEEPESWVLTRRDYEAVPHKAAMLRFVSEALLDRPFLFIGYGMTDQDNHLLDILRELDVQLGSWKHTHLALFPNENRNKDRDPELSKLGFEFPVYFPRDRLAELLPTLQERASMNVIQPRKSSAWRRILFQKAMSFHAHPWWKWYQNPIVLPDVELRDRNFDSDQIMLHAAVRGSSPAIPTAELLREKRIIVLGNMGVGKTTYLQRLFGELSEVIAGFKERPRLLIELRDAVHGQSFRRLAEIKLDGEHPEALDEFIKANGIFLVDGLDEVLEGSDLLNDLRQFEKTQSNCTFFLSSRPRGTSADLDGNIPGFPGFPEWPVFHLLPFSNDQVRQYLKSRLHKIPEIEPHLWDVFRYPVFLNMYCKMREENPSAAPTSTGEILSELLERTLQRAKNRLNLREITIQNAKHILAEEAFEMQKRGRFLKAPGRWFENAATDSDIEFRNAFQKELVDGSILVARGEELEFQHRVWQSYLAGVYIAEQEQSLSGWAQVRDACASSVDAAKIDPRWWLALRFAAGISRESEEFVWKWKEADPAAVARIIPTRVPDRAQWAFSTLIETYRDPGAFLRRDELGGIFDKEVLGQLAAALGDKCYSVLRELLQDENKIRRRLGIEVAIAGRLQDFLGEEINRLLCDKENDVVSCAVHAAEMFDIGSPDSLFIAFETLIEREMTYSPAAGTAVEILRSQSPSRIADFVVDRIRGAFEGRHKLNATIRWILPEMRTLISDDQLGNIAESFRLDLPWKPIPRALVHQALGLQGDGTDKILILAYAVGVQDETGRHFLEPEDREEPIEKRIEKRLLDDPGATRLAVFWILRKASRSIEVPFRALRLFAKAGGDPFKYQKELLLVDSPFSIQIARRLVEAYRDVNSRIADKLAREYNFAEVSTDAPDGIRPQKKRPRLDLEDVVKKYPGDWIARIDDSLASEAGMLPPELREAAQTAALEILKEISPREALNEIELGRYSINRSWQNALKVLEKLGIDDLPAYAPRIIGRLALADSIGLFFTRKVLETACKKWEATRTELLEMLRSEIDATVLGSIVSILEEAGVEADVILDRLENLASKYRDNINAAFPILSLCDTARRERSKMLREFCKSSSDSVRFMALAVRVNRPGAKPSDKTRYAYIDLVTSLAKKESLGLIEFGHLLRSVSCEGREEQLGKLIVELYPKAKEAAHRHGGAIAPGAFEKEQIFRWAVSLLEKGQTKRSYEILQEISSRQDMRYFATIAEDARIAWLGRRAPDQERSG